MKSSNAKLQLNISRHTKAIKKEHDRQSSVWHPVENAIVICEAMIVQGYVIFENLLLSTFPVRCNANLHDHANHTE